jgi:O-antigen/teichoic acid export membrane protein
MVRTGAAWKALSEVVTQIARITFAFMLARLLTPAEYGLAGLALVIASFVLVFSDLALGAALVQRPSITERDRSTTFWLGIGSGTTLTLVGLALADPASHFFHQPDLRWLMSATSFTFLIVSLGSTQRALLTREMDFRRLETRVMIATVLSGLLGVTVAAAGLGPWAIVGQNLAFGVISTAFLWITVQWRPRFLFSRESVRTLGGFSLKVLGNRMLYVSEDSITNVLIGRLLGPASLGLYSVAQNVVLTPFSRFAIPVAEVLFPAFSRIQDERDRIAALWLRALPLLAAVALPALAGLVVVAPDFVTLFLGQKWDGAVPVIQALAIMGAMRAVQGWNSSIILATGRTDLLVQFALASLVLTVAAIVAGWFFWDSIVAVAVAYALFHVALQVPYLFAVTRVVGVRVRDVFRALSGVLAATVVMGVVVYVARVGLEQLGLGAAPRLGVCIATGFGMFALAFRVLAPAPYTDVVSNVSRLVKARRSPVPRAADA